MQRYKNQKKRGREKATKRVDVKERLIEIRQLRETCVSWRSVDDIRGCQIKQGSKGRS